jgi:hypothetical protein
MNSKKLFLNPDAVIGFSQQTADPALTTLAKVYETQLIGSRYSCIIRRENQNIICLGQTPNLQTTGSFLGRAYFPRINNEPRSVSTPTLRPTLISLNTGSFTSLYFERAQVLIQYLQTIRDTSLFVNLQDIPDEPEILQRIADLGFEVYYINTIIYSAGQFKNRKNAGIACLVNKNLLGFNCKLLDISVSFHKDGFFDYKKCFPSCNSQDMLVQPATLYLTLQNQDSNEIFILANNYISAFSFQKSRLENVEYMIKTISEMKTMLLHRIPGNKIITRLTGDFNLYGYDTLGLPFGLKSEPFAHLPAAISALITGFRPFSIFSGKIFTTGNNIPNSREIKMFKELLESHQFVYQTNYYNQNFPTISLEVKDFIPKPLKFLFKGLKVSWSLDFCVTPEYEGKITIAKDSQPFGHDDHKTLIVSL